MLTWLKLEAAAGVVFDGHRGVEDLLPANVGMKSH